MLAQVVEGGGHRAVLVLERELALVHVRVRVRVGVRVRARARAGVRVRGRDRVRGRGRGRVRVRAGLTLSASPGMAATTMCPPLGEVAAVLGVITLPPPTVVSTWSIHTWRCRET